MKRFLLAVVCVFVGGTVTAVKVTNAVLDRLDAAERAKVVPIHIRMNPELLERT